MDYIDTMGGVLRNRKRKASFATYAMGLLGEGERKSVEPIAARACPDPARVNAEHQRLLHFVADSTWSDRDVRLAAARYAVPIITRRSPIKFWIVDDTGMLKQGTHSVGVQRQYTGSAGKITNCQVATSLTLATQHGQLPVDFELYLPRAWTDDPERREEARIPKGIKFRTKPQLALDMIRRAVEADLPRGIVLADSAYGDAVHFRSSIREQDLHYAVGVSKNMKVWRTDGRDVRRGDPISLKKLAATIPRKKRRMVTWRQGTKTPLSGRFAMTRVVPCRADGTPPSQREVAWLLIEWEEGKKESCQFHLCSLPRGLTRKRLVRIVKARWRTEQAYRELKGDLGFDHFEGRSFPGWHHHVSVVLCCYAFVAAERAIAFFPSGGAANGPPEQIAA